MVRMKLIPSQLSRSVALLYGKRCKIILIVVQKRGTIRALAPYHDRHSFMMILKIGPLDHAIRPLLQIGCERGLEAAAAAAAPR